MRDALFLVFPCHIYRAGMILLRTRTTLTRVSSTCSLACGVIRPDLVCYNCAVKACGSSGEFAQALGVMDVRELLSASVSVFEVWIVLTVFYTR